VAPYTQEVPPSIIFVLFTIITYNRYHPSQVSWYWLQCNSHGHGRPRCCHLIGCFCCLFAHWTPCVVRSQFFETMPVNSVAAGHFVTSMAWWKQVLLADRTIGHVLFWKGSKREWKRFVEAREQSKSNPIHHTNNDDLPSLLCSCDHQIRGHQCTFRNHHNGESFLFPLPDKIRTRDSDMDFPCSTSTGCRYYNGSLQILRHSFDNGCCNHGKRFIFLCVVVGVVVDIEERPNTNQSGNWAQSFQ